MELADGGDFLDLLETTKALPEVCVPSPSFSFTFKPSFLAIILSHLISYLLSPSFLSTHAHFFPQSRARYFYSQFGSALQYMHSIGFAHRDIKCENILLNKAHTKAMLTDFG